MTFNARALLVDLMPPILVRPARQLWHRMCGFGSHTFEGSYRSLAEVPTKGRYDDDELVGPIVANGMNHLRLAGPTGKKKNDLTGHLILPELVSQFTDDRLTVLDFGGGAAIGLISILDHVPCIDLAKFSYVLVETPAMCRAVKIAIGPILKEKFGTSSFVNVLEDIPDSVSSPLIANASSSLQYLPDYKSVLRRLVRLSPKFFVVSQTPVTEGPTYARQQLNLAYRRLAHWVFNRSEFISEMDTLGYSNIFSVDHNLPLTHKNAPGLSSMTSMVFRRRSDKS